MTADLLIPAAVLGPAAAALGWLAASPLPWLRRSLGGLVALGSVAVGWGVFWLAYRGEAPAWGGFVPSLLTASLAAFVATAALLVVPRVEALPPREAAPAVVGLGVGVTAVLATAFSGSLVAVAVLLPVPTVAAGAAALSGRDRAEARGLVGLAAADILAATGLAALLVEAGSTLVAPVGVVPGVGLLLAGAAVKAGAVPGVGTWRLASTPGPGAPGIFPLRAQGVVLAVLAGVVVGGGTEAVPPLLWAAGGAALAGGATALWARSPENAAAAVAGVGAAIVFLSLGLGGTIGVRTSLLLFPPFLLAAGVATGVLGRPTVPGERHPAWRWLGGVALVVAAASLLGLPPSGGFPGTWLALSLAWARDDALVHLPAAAGAIVGIGLGALAAVGLPRGIRSSPAAAVAGLGVSVLLLYMGAQPVRLGAGWLVRVEAELGLPEVLPTAGAPSLPPIGGWDLLWAGLPAVAVVAALVAAGRGLRAPDGPFLPLLSPPFVLGTAWGRPMVRRVGAAVGAVREAGAGIPAALVLEAAALAVAAWVVIRGMALGFL